MVGVLLFVAFFVGFAFSNLHFGDAQTTKIAKSGAVTIQTPQTFATR